VEEPEEPFPTALVITASGITVAVVAVGLLVYFKKRKRKVGRSAMIIGYSNLTVIGLTR
jgi:multisubunit Na+/H+ antiporter MnhC subunit